MMPYLCTPRRKAAARKYPARCSYKVEAKKNRVAPALELFVKEGTDMYVGSLIEACLCSFLCGSWSRRVSVNCLYAHVCAPVFGLLEAKTAGKPIPGDVAYDKDGNSTTDPAAALQGAIRVFDRCATYDTMNSM